MASMVPAQYGVEYIFYVSVVSQADTKIMQSNPTIASGDWKISKDGGALANLTTLPAVTPASSKLVKVTVSATEMQADNVTIIGSDASGAEWCDLVINVQTSVRRIDDLAYPTTTGRSIDVTATGAVGVDWGNVENPTTTVGLTGTTAGLIDGAITAAKIATDAIDNDAIAASAVTEIQSGLATAAALATLQTSVDDLPTNAELATSQAAADDATLAAIAALNNLSAAQVNAEVDTALADYDAPTKAELDSGLAAADDAVLAAIAALTIPGANTIADAVLSRGVSNVQDTADTTSLAAVILATFESAVVGTTWTIRKTGGTTFATKTIATDPDAEPIVSVT